jgi:hypothetical protein
VLQDGGRDHRDAANHHQQAENGQGPFHGHILQFGNSLETPGSNWDVKRVRRGVLPWRSRPS